MSDYCVFVPNACNSTYIAYSAKAALKTFMGFVERNAVAVITRLPSMDNDVVHSLATIIRLRISDGNEPTQPSPQRCAARVLLACVRGSPDAGERHGLVENVVDCLRRCDVAVAPTLCEVLLCVLLPKLAAPSGSAVVTIFCDAYPALARVIPSIVSDVRTRLPSPSYETTVATTGLTAALDALRVLASNRGQCSLPAFPASASLLARALSGLFDATMLHAGVAGSSDAACVYKCAAICVNKLSSKQHGFASAFGIAGGITAIVQCLRVSIDHTHDDGAGDGAGACALCDLNLMLLHALLCAVKYDDDNHKRLSAIPHVIFVVMRALADASVVVRTATDAPKRHTAAI